MDSKEQALAKAISTRVHQLEGQEQDWKEKWKILLISGDKESLLHVVFIAMEEYAKQFHPTPLGDTAVYSKEDMIGFAEYYEKYTDEYWTTGQKGGKPKTTEQLLTEYINSKKK